MRYRFFLAQNKYFEVRRTRPFSRKLLSVRYIRGCARRVLTDECLGSVETLRDSFLSIGRVPIVSYVRCNLAK